VIVARFRRWASESFLRAEHQNLGNIVRLLEPGGPETGVVDLGYDDGSRTALFARAVGTTRVHGLEIVEERAQLARGRGIEVEAADLNARLPFEESTFDVVCSNQVIEHVHDTDTFTGEVFRILKPGGYAVVSTENLASWHNIGALALGWQPFSLTNVSKVALGLWNPVALHRGVAETPLPSWQHMRVFSYRGLRELFDLHGFDVEALVGAGYYLPAQVARLDGRHAAFLALKARRAVGTGPAV